MQKLERCRHRATNAIGLAPVVLALCLSMPSAARAQLEQFGLGGGDVVPLTTDATFIVTGPGSGQLHVSAELLPGWNTYSITQKPGGPITTKIKVGPSSEYAVGPFVAVNRPDVHPEAAFGNMLVEKHVGRVTWVAPITFAPGLDPAKLQIGGTVYAQVCEKVCRPPTDYPFTATLAADPARVAAVVTAAQIVLPPAPPLGNAVAPAPSTSVSPATAATLPTTGAVPGAVFVKLPGTIAGGAGLPAAGSPGVAAGGIANAPASSAPAGVGVYEPAMSHLHWYGELDRSTIAPGGTAKLMLRAQIEPKWHVYAIAPPQKTGNQATLFVFDEQPGIQFGAPTPDREPLPPHGTSAIPDSTLLPYYENEVKWTIDVAVSADVKPGTMLELSGMMAFQTCDEASSCDRPQGVRIAVPLEVVAVETKTETRPLRFFDPQPYGAVSARVTGAGHAAATHQQSVAAATGYDIAQIRVQSNEGGSPLPVMLGIGLLAGFILNFMPCVLPVIGLKILSFVEQGGHDRRRVFALNAWYSLGILTVFWILATVPVVLRVGFGKQFGWGEQFSYDGFNITLVAIVFAMALSFLGVWEIPIPGFAGGTGAQKAASKEGAVGAFVKGMITTVLATPCSGPFLGTAVAFAFTSPPLVTYAMFTAMGLGMASPYLLIGLRPELVKLLPKPGEWMDTFKQLMGFVLIGTVLWLMLPIDARLMMPTLVLLAGISAACWWIGRTPGYAEFPQKLKAWVQATAFGAVVGWLAFAMPQVTDPLPWKQFTMAEFVADVNAGKTVLVEFTADWCATCKTLKAANLDRSKTKDRIEKNGVLVYEMNIDEASEEEKAFFRRMQPAGSVPLVAIFPADKKYEPIRFGDGYTQTQILDALDHAGPSRNRDDAMRLGMQ